jgi:hypothetical protein
MGQQSKIPGITRLHKPNYAEHNEGPAGERKPATGEELRSNRSRSSIGTSKTSARIFTTRYPEN